MTLPFWAAFVLAVSTWQPTENKRLIDQSRLVPVGIDYLSGRQQFKECVYGASRSACYDRPAKENWDWYDEQYGCCRNQPDEPEVLCGEIEFGKNCSGDGWKHLGQNTCCSRSWTKCLEAVKEDFCTGDGYKYLGHGRCCTTAQSYFPFSCENGHEHLCSGDGWQYFGNNRCCTKGWVSCRHGVSQDLCSGDGYKYHGNGLCCVANPVHDIFHQCIDADQETCPDSDGWKYLGPNRCCQQVRTARRCFSDARPESCRHDALTFIEPSTCCTRAESARLTCAVGIHTVGNIAPAFCLSDDRIFLQSKCCTQSWVTCAKGTSQRFCNRDGYQYLGNGKCCTEASTKALKVTCVGGSQDSCGGDGWTYLGTTKCCTRGFAKCIDDVGEEMCSGDFKYVGHGKCCTSSAHYFDLTCVKGHEDLCLGHGWKYFGNSKCCTKNWAKCLQAAREDLCSGDGYKYLGDGVCCSTSRNYYELTCMSGDETTCSGPWKLLGDGRCCTRQWAHCVEDVSEGLCSGDGYKYFKDGKCCTTSSTYFEITCVKGQPDLCSGDGWKYLGGNKCCTKDWAKCHKGATSGYCNQDGYKYLGDGMCCSSSQTHFELTCAQGYESGCPGTPGDAWRYVGQSQCCTRSWPRCEMRAPSMFCGLNGYKYLTHGSYKELPSGVCCLSNASLGYKSIQSIPTGEHGGSTRSYAETRTVPWLWLAVSSFLQLSRR
ncbi:unnamed protein product [Durusdinium trenchii]|uniref:Uncharacterized protein n=2 Tax=Durusdinium trenchii TaxID=1381693 RepID=A0ABP0QJD1_9DINO